LRATAELESTLTGRLDIEDAYADVIDVKVKRHYVVQVDADSDPQPSLYLLERALAGRPWTHASTASRLSAPTWSCGMRRTSRTKSRRAASTGTREARIWSGALRGYHA
jgi:hypothetical protein